MADIIKSVNDIDTVDHSTNKVHGANTVNDTIHNTDNNINITKKTVGSTVKDNPININNMFKKDGGNLNSIADLTVEERRKMASKAGKASVEARRKKKDLREIAKTMLELQAKKGFIRGSLGENVDTLGEDAENMTVGEVLTARMAIEAANGSFKAYETLRDTAGYKPTAQVEVAASVSPADMALVEKVKKRLELQENN